MSDSNNKRLFLVIDVRHAKLKIRLQYDGISKQSFQIIYYGYLEKDKSIMEYIQRFKENNKKMSKRNMKYAINDNEQAEDLLAKFGIEDEELENIFDIIAKSNPEL